MTSASTSTSTSTQPAFPIAEHLAEKAKTRDRWAANLNENAQIVSKKISESISIEIFEKLNAVLSDPYRKNPDSNHPLKLYFSLEINRPEQAKKIKKWAQDAADLQPFKDWFTKFISQENETEVESFSSLSGFKSRNSKIETSYFEEKMAILGRQIVNNLTEFLTVHKEKNFPLEYKVEWHRRAEKYFPTYGQDNTLYVELWIGDGENRLPSIVTGAIAYNSSQLSGISPILQQQSISSSTSSSRISSSTSSQPNRKGFFSFLF